jgi:peptidoglycan/LPS O-acetylase OafA/YrhL
MQPIGSPQKRIGFFDLYRALMVFGVMSLHAAMTYMAYVPGWWYVIDPEHSLGFTVWVLISDTFLMPAMFFAAGYFAPASLHRRGPGAFLRDKTIRIGIPWAVGTLALAPLFARASLVSLKIPLPPTYGEFIRHYWLGPAYQQGHFWYLGLLLAFFVLFIPLGDSFRRSEPGWRSKSRHASARWVLALWFVGSAGFFLSTLWRPADSWLNIGYVLYFQPARLTIHLLAFLLGALAWRDRWLEGQAPLIGTLVLWGGLTVVSGVGIALFQLSVPQKNTAALKAAHALLHCGAATSIAVFTLLLLRTLLDRPSRTAAMLGETSYGTYWLHQMILMPMAAFLIPWHMPILLKFSAVLLLSYGICTLLSGGVLRRLPGLRRIF